MGGGGKSIDEQRSMTQEQNKSLTRMGESEKERERGRGRERERERERERVRHTDRPTREERRER